MNKAIFLIPFLTILSISGSGHPGWSPVYYSNSTTAYGIVTIDGLPASAGDLVAAFVEGECRAAHEVIVNQGTAYVTLVIQGEVQEEIIFRIWDADRNTIYEVPTSFQTNPGGIIGYPPSYLALEGVVATAQTIPCLSTNRLLILLLIMTFMGISLHPRPRRTTHCI